MSADFGTSFVLFCKMSTVAGMARFSSLSLSLSLSHTHTHTHTTTTTTMAMASGFSVNFFPTNFLAVMKNLVTGTTYVPYCVMLPYLQTERISSRKSPSFIHKGNMRRSSSWSKYETMQSPSNIVRLSEFLDVISNTEHEEWFKEVEIPGCDSHSCRQPLLCLS